jgi:hypothetical protein
MMRAPPLKEMTAINNEHQMLAITEPHNGIEVQGNSEEDMRYAAESTDTDDDYDDDADDYDEDDSNDSWSLHIHVLESAVLKAYRGNLDLAAFFLGNLGEVLGLRNSRDISKQKVTSWIPGIKYSPNSTETTSGQTQSSHSSHGSRATNSTNDKSGKRQRSSTRKGKETGDQGDDEGDQEERDPKKLKEDDIVDELEVGLLLACPFWKLDPAKYNSHYRPDANTRKGKYRTCEGPGFTDIQRLK